MTSGQRGYLINCAEEEEVDGVSGADTRELPDWADTFSRGFGFVVFTINHTYVMTPEDDVNSELRKILIALREPVTELSTLITLLASPLGLFSLLPPDLNKYNIQPISGKLSPTTLRFIPSLQAILVQHVLPTWEAAVDEAGLTALVESYFCPQTSGGVEGFVVAYAYQSLLLPPVGPSSIKILLRMTTKFPVDDQFALLFTHDSVVPIVQREILWETYIQACFSVPAKVMNTLGRETPEALSSNAYFSTIVRDAERLIYKISTYVTYDQYLGVLSTLVIKLLRTGMFPSTHLGLVQPSFFGQNGKTIQKRLGLTTSYSNLWITLLSSLPSPSFQQIFTSLLTSLTWEIGLEFGRKAEIRVIQNARFLRQLVGPLRKEDTNTWENVNNTILKRSWDEELARTLVYWVVGPDPKTVDREGLRELQSRTLDVWASSDHVLYSLLAKHKYITAVLVLCISSQDSSSSSVKRLLTDQMFLNSISKYLSHQDPAIRRCGMFVAEIVASKCGQKLDFDSWDGDGESREWFRALRRLAIEGGLRQFLEEDSDDEDGDEEDSGDVGTESSVRLVTPGLPLSHDVQEEDNHARPNVAYDSDDSLTGYASPSSRSPSPTISELEEIAKDPSLNSGRQANKIQKPVFLLQLGDLLSSQKGDDQQEPARHEMALKEGEALIRRKFGYGMELDENTVNLTLAFIRLQDNYELDDFLQKKQVILTALVACCPERAAPCMIEQFFSNQYSAETRSIILTALVLGAKELAGMTKPLVQPTFPSKMLPSPLHQKYLSSQNLANPVQSLLDGITLQAINQSREKAESEIPQIAREKQLRLRGNLPARSIVEIRRTQHTTNASKSSVTQSFSGISGEFFIMPLINRFWAYLHDERSREARSAYSAAKYRGAGTGMILHSLTLAQFMSSLAVLLYMAQNSTAFLAIMAPAALELAVAVGTRPLSQSPPSGGIDEENTGEKQAIIIATALELALVVIDCCWNLDQGRSISLDRPELLLAVKELATGIFRTLEKGMLLPGSGGEAYARSQRSSAGLLLKVDEIIVKWRASMIAY